MRLTRRERNNVKIDGRREVIRFKDDVTALACAQVNVPYRGVAVADNQLDYDASQSFDPNLAIKTRRRFPMSWHIEHKSPNDNRENLSTVVKPVERGMLGGSTLSDRVAVTA